LSEGKINLNNFISAIVGMNEAESMYKKLAAGDTTMVKVLVDVRL
jgi:threonine dehydrogenase-like Zn-dependent dehydrogenase